MRKGGGERQRRRREARRGLELGVLLVIVANAAGHRQTCSTL